VTVAQDRQHAGHWLAFGSDREGVCVKGFHIDNTSRVDMTCQPPDTKKFRSTHNARQRLLLKRICQPLVFWVCAPSPRPEQKAGEGVCPLSHVWERVARSAGRGRRIAAWLTHKPRQLMPQGAQRCNVDGWKNTLISHCVSANGV